MTYPSLADRIRAKHWRQIDRFRTETLSPAGDVLSGLGPTDPPRRAPGLGHLPSLTTRHACVSVVGDCSPTALLGSNPELTGRCFSVSIVGHHRVLNGHLHLPAPELDAWASAIAGPEWAPFLHRAGRLSGTEGRLTTMYYRVFLDDTDTPIAPPHHWPGGDLTPITAAAH